jgi:MoxR-like ATPase
MESQALIGCFLLPDSKTQWSDGALTQAIKTPRAVILLDEPTRNPDACEIYQTLLDEKYYDIAETGERVWIADGVSFFAADNQNGDGDDTGRYDGTFAVNSAFGDRFKAKLQCFYMAPAHEAALLVSLTGINKNSALEIAEFANIMRGMATAGEIEEPISFRRLNALAEFIVDGIPHDLAMETAVFAFIRHEQDRETYRTQAAVHLTQLRA